MTASTTATSTDDLFGGLRRPGELARDAVTRLERRADYTKKVVGTVDGQRLLEAAADEASAGIPPGTPRRSARKAAEPAATPVQVGIDGTEVPVCLGSNHVPGCAHFPAAPAVPSSAAGAAAFAEVAIAAIDTAGNVRADVGDVDELAASIRSVGVLQPVRVRRAGERFVLVYGHRRLAAARAAGLERIPATIVDDDADRLLEQLVENMQRADLNPLEEAKALRAILDADPGLTQAALATRIGKAAPTVANLLRLLEAAPEVQAAVADGRTTLAHAKAVMGFAPKTQAEWIERAIGRGDSAKELERTAAWERERAEAAKASEQKARDRALEQLLYIREKLAKLDLGIPIQVEGGYYDGGTAGAVRDALAKDGRPATVVRVTHARPTGCDCVAWRVAWQYDRVIVAKACVDGAHLAAKEKAADAKRREGYELQARVKAQLAGQAPHHAAASTLGLQPIQVSRELARFALWALLEYRIPDWSVEHGGKRNAGWATITGLTDEQLAAELAAVVLAGVSDQYGYHLPWEELAAELGVAGDEAAP